MTKQTAKEKWKLIADHHLYYYKYVVSDKGVIKQPSSTSIKLFGSGTKSVRKKSAKLLKTYVNPKNGLLCVKLKLKDLSKKPVTKYVHKLVAEVWNENPDDLPIVIHKRKPKTNNEKDNLQWATHSKGLQNRRDNSDLEILSHAIINKCLNLHNNGKTLPQISTALGIKETEIFRYIKYGNSLRYANRISRENK